MILYNVTTKVAPAIADAWLEWMTNTHIKEIKNTGCFTEAKLLKLLDQDESEGPTYALQLTAESMAIYNSYIYVHSAGLKAKAFEKWGDQFISFRSVMQTVY